MISEETTRDRNCELFCIPLISGKMLELIKNFKNPRIILLRNLFLAKLWTYILTL